MLSSLFCVDLKDERARLPHLIHAIYHQGWEKEERDVEELKRADAIGHLLKEIAG